MDRIRELLARTGDLTAEEMAELNGLIAEQAEQVESEIDGVPTAEQVETIEFLAEASEQVESEQAERIARSERTEAAQQRMAEARAAREEREAAAAAEGGDGEGEGDAGEGEGDGGGEGGSNRVDPAEVEVVEEEREPVLASGGRQSPTVTSMVENTPETVRSSPQHSSSMYGLPSLTAAAEVPGYSTGQELEGTLGIAEAVIARHGRFKGQSGKVDRRMVPHGFNADTAQRFGTVQIRKPFPAELTVNSLDSVEETMAAIQFAVDESRLPGGSLVAAGGWCSPSETVYDLTARETTDGLFSLPEINAARGGIRFVENGGPSFADIFSAPNGAFFGTEAGDMADPYVVNNVTGTTETPAAEKMCAEIPCPVFDECRLGFHGMCVRAGLLIMKSYPEMVQRFIEGLIVAHRHRMSLRWVNDIADRSTGVVFPEMRGTLHSILGALELQVWDYRHKHRLAMNASLEVVLPVWLRGVIRTDLAKRIGLTPDQAVNVTDANIDAWFRSRNVNPQWIYWQDAFDGTNPNMGGATPPVAWPGSVDILMYPAGTWVAATSDIFSIDTLYDSTLLKTNDFTALFTEEAYCILQQNADSRLLTIPLVPDGSTAGGIEMAGADGLGAIY